MGHHIGRRLGGSGTMPGSVDRERSPEGFSKPFGRVTPYDMTGIRDYRHI